MRVFKLLTKITWLAGFLLFTINLEAQNNKQVIIKPNAHTSTIIDMVLVPGKPWLLTSSFDKTIKIWNTDNHAYIDELIGEIGDEDLGKYKQMSVSPDGKTVAAICIAFPTNNVNIGNKYGIRIFDIATRNLIKVHNVTSRGLLGIHYLNQGNLLAVASETFIAFLDPTSGQQIDSFEVPSEEKISHTLFLRDKLYFSTESGKLFYLEGKFNSVVLAHDFGVDVWALSGNESTGNIGVTTASKQVILLDSNHHPKQSISNDNYPISLAFSPKGDQLLVGFYYTEEGCKLYKIGPQSLDFICNLANQTGLVGTMHFVDSNTVATGGGDRYSVDFWSISKADSAILIKSNQSSTIPFMAACEYGGAIAFSTDLGFQQTTFPYRWMYSISRNQLIPIVPYGSLLYMLPKPVTTQGAFSLRVKQQQGAKSSLEVYLNGNLLNTISDLDVSAHTILPNNLIVIGSTKGQIRVFHPLGFEVADLTGHTDKVTALTINAMGEYLISSSIDGTIRFWPINQLVYNDLFNPTPSEQIQNPKFNKKLKKWGLEREINDQSTNSWVAVMEACWKHGENAWGDNLYQQLSFFKQMFLNHIKPEMNVFFDINGEWVFWNKDNYYSGSKKGCRMIGFHENQGVDKEAKFYPFEQFDLTNNRPDLIHQFFSPYDTATIKAYYQLYLKRLGKFNLDPSQLSENTKLPSLMVDNVSDWAITSQISLKLQAHDSFSKLSKLIVVVNNVPIYGSEGKDLSGLETQSINTLQNNTLIEPIQLGIGQNKIEVSVINEHGSESLKETFVVRYAPKAVKKPNLYVITIGVSNYENSSHNLTYAGKDAEDVAKTLSSQKDRYSQIFPITIVNEQVTKENILKLKATLLKTEVDDQVIIFLAGHGIMDKKFNFYFATHNMDFKAPEAFGISFTDIEGLLDGIPSRNKLLLVDACHSGEPEDNSDIDLSTLGKIYKPLPEGIKVTTYVQRGGKSVTSETETNNQLGLKNSISIMSELFNDLRQSSGTVVISAASADGYALESDAWKNGVFTYSLLNGLKDLKADANNDGIIQISELKDYILLEVETLTQGKQQPSMRRENPENDFQIW